MDIYKYDKPVLCAAFDCFIFVCEWKKMGGDACMPENLTWILVDMDWHNKPAIIIYCTSALSDLFSKLKDWISLQVFKNKSGTEFSQVLFYLKIWRMDIIMPVITCLFKKLSKPIRPHDPIPFKTYQLSLILKTEAFQCVVNVISMIS